jgi:hypothetical protein
VLGIADDQSPHSILSPTTKLYPLIVGSMEMKDVVPSSFRREATA